MITQRLKNEGNLRREIKFDISIASFNAAPVYNSYILIFCK